MKTYPIEFYQTLLSRKWRWRITADNGRIIGASTQGYRNRTDCVDNAELLGKCFTKAFEGK